jgi:hypothetical protein
MECLLLILEFFSGIILLFGLGKVTGHFLKLNEYIENQQNKKNKS